MLCKEVTLTHKRAACQALPCFSRRWHLPIKSCMSGPPGGDSGCHHVRLEAGQHWHACNHFSFWSCCWPSNWPSPAVTTFKGSAVYKSESNKQAVFIVAAAISRQMASEQYTWIYVIWAAKYCTQNVNYLKHINNRCVTLHLCRYNTSNKYRKAKPIISDK